MAAEKYNIKQLVKLALDEDIGTGDITTAAVIPIDMRAKAALIAKEVCVVCGLDVAEAVFKELDPETEFVRNAKDGEMVKPGHVLAEVSASARALLSGERTALNFLQRLSGISTKTHEYAEKLKGFDMKMTDTRKTTPGMRELEKYAVRTGGGKNHRSGLYDAILIKDNHIKLVGLENAVSKAKETGREAEVEAGSLEEVEKALKGGADIIMLDNMPIEDIRKAVDIIGKHAVIEVSGGVNEGNIEEIAKLGVHWISVGRLTHSVPLVEISMEMVGVCSEKT